MSIPSQWEPHFHRGSLVITNRNQLTHREQAGGETCIRCAFLVRNVPCAHTANGAV